MLSRRSLICAAPALLLSRKPATAWSHGQLTLAQQQANYLKLQFGMFADFGMQTFTQTEQDLSTDSPNNFNPSSLNTSQWMTAANSAKMKYAVLTCKTSGGFCIWPTATTPHSIASASPWYSANGRIDVTAVFVASARAAGILPVLYFCLYDATFIANNPGYTQAAYKTYVTAQLTELLTNYGGIGGIWYDSAFGGLGATFPFSSFADMTSFIKGIQPQCLIFNNSHTGNLSNTDCVIYENGPGGNGAVANGNLVVSEECQPISTLNNWYWKTAGSSPRSAASIVTEAHRCFAATSNYLLACPPDNTGAMPSDVTSVLTTVGGSI